jgi:hypothetical protein
VAATSSSATGVRPKPITIKIHYAWIQLWNGKWYDCEGDSLGTVIGPDLILTHNHFSQQLGHQLEEVFTFEDEQGRTIQWRPRDLQLTPFDGGTLLIRLPTKTYPDQAMVANKMTRQRLAVGDWVQISHRDATKNYVIEDRFQIEQIKNGQLKLADPAHLIKTGDSGGGAFWQGQLIGNIWSIDMDPAGNVQGEFNVALAPTPITRP